MEGAALDSIAISGFPTEKILLPINRDNNNEEEMTGLEFALGSASQCIQSGLNDDSGAGAGANAGSRGDMTFVTVNPLSELVWSPHRGLSLKCADWSLAEKKPSLLWGTRSCNVALSTPQSIIECGTKNDKPLAEGNSFSSQKAFHLESEVSERFILANSPKSTAGIIPVCGTSHEQDIGTSDKMEEMNTAAKASVLYIIQKEEDDQEKYEQTNNQRISISEMKENAIPSLPNKASMLGPEKVEIDDSLLYKADEPGIAQIKPGAMDFDEVISSDRFDGGRNVGIGNQTGGLEIIVPSEVSTFKQCTVHNAPVPILTSPVSRHEGLVSVIERDGASKIRTPESTGAVPLEKRGLRIENGLQPMKAERGWPEVGIIIASLPGDEMEHIPQRNEKKLPKKMAAPVEVSPNSSRSCLYRRKDKERVSSDGEADGRISKEKDDSHESVESCSSTGMFSAGKRRWGFGEQLFIENKRVKKETQESTCSGFVIRHDSSFMNWISNMTKRLSKSIQDETSCTALTVTCHDQKLISHNKNQDSGCGNMGFKTIFQSLYCPSMTVQETRTWNVNHQIEGEKGPGLAIEMHDTSSSPMSCDGKNDGSFKRFLLSNEKFNQGTSGDGEGAAIQPKISAASFTLNQAHHKIKATDSCKLVCRTEKCGVSSSNSSFSQHKIKIPEKNSSGLPSDEKVDHNVGVTDPNTSSSSAINKRNPLESIWITRFSSKVLGPLSNVPQCSKNTGAALDRSPDCVRFIPHSQNFLDYFKDHRDLEVIKDPTTEDVMDAMGKNLQACEVNTKASFGLRLIKGHTHQKSKSKLNPILPSQRFKSSEAMASVFARRLDALRHIIPSNVTDLTHATAICFFCGIKGHNIQDCSEITETELEDLLRNINSYDGAEESPCLCIRCFQLNHWAVACPNATSRRPKQSDDSPSLVNHISFSKIHGNPGNDIFISKEERNLKLLENKGSQYQFACAHAAFDGKNSRLDNKLIYRQILKGKMAVSGRTLDSKPVKKYVASNSLKNKSKENQVAPPCNFFNRQIPAEPKGIFEAVRRLRLSRTDILKWMKSSIPLTFLKGFYLRLRLGKWEEGLGGTGYHVALINGAPSERSTESSKTPLSVDIGGLKCLVENQFISNCNFVEDELMAWWCATPSGCGKVPSKEDLQMKLEERKRLGF